MVSCVVDGQTQTFCLPRLANHTVQLWDEYNLKTTAALLSSAFGTSAMDDKGFASLLSMCTVSATKYPHGTPSTVSGDTPIPTSGMNSTSCHGSMYKVRYGDTCESIATANSLAVDRFIYYNNLDFKCISLVVDDYVCVDKDDSCSLYAAGRSIYICNPRRDNDVNNLILQITDQDTRLHILKDRAFTLTELLAWNPIIHSTCDNLGSLHGRFAFRKYRELWLLEVDI